MGYTNVSDINLGYLLATDFIIMLVLYAILKVVFKKKYNNYTLVMSSTYVVMMLSMGLALLLIGSKYDIELNSTDYNVVSIDNGIVYTDDIKVVADGCEIILTEKDENLKLTRKTCGNKAKLATYKYELSIPYSDENRSLIETLLN